MFLTELRVHNYLCKHSDDSFTIDILHESGHRILKCKECDFSLSLVLYFHHMISATISLSLAEHYVNWSGDRFISIKLNLYYLDEHLPRTQFITTFETVTIVTKLLKILHEPIKKDNPQPTSKDICFFRNTVSSQLQNMIDYVSTYSEDIVSKKVGKIAHTALILLKTIFDTESERYFDSLVPYIKQVHRRDACDRIFKQRDESQSLVHLFQNRITESVIINDYLSKTNVGFHAIHVAVLCYLCQQDKELVLDIVLDFAGKFCRGYYDDPFSAPCRNIRSTLLSEMEALFDKHISLERNTKIHRYLELLKTGGFQLADSFSNDFFKTYWEIKSAIYVCSDEAQKYSFNYMFPRVLFRNYTDYYAFWAALSHYSMEVDVVSKNINEILMGVVAPQNVISKCKFIYRFVKKALEKVKTFHECFVEAKQKLVYKGFDDTFLFRDKDREVETFFFWTKDIVESFFKLDLDFEKKTMKSIQWLLKLPLYAKNDPGLIPVPLVHYYHLDQSKEMNEVNQKK